MSIRIMPDETDIPQCEPAGQPRSRIDGTASNAERVFVSAALGIPCLFDVEKSIRYGGLVWPLSFWKDVRRHYHAMASIKLNREPRRRKCQFAYRRTRRPANPKRNRLLTLNF